jgi:membrane-bound ClpP family serine protease
MSFIDAILEGIGNVVLLILGIIVAFIGLFMMSSKNTIIGFILIIIGMGMAAAKYKRS